MKPTSWATQIGSIWHAAAPCLPVDAATWHLLRRERGRCPLCRGLLLHAARQPQDPAGWQQRHAATRAAIRKQVIAGVTDLSTPDEGAAHHLMHACCRRRTGDGTSPALLPPPGHQGLPEPVAWKRHSRCCGGAAARRRYPANGRS